jgi:hypothetical protein
MMKMDQGGNASGDHEGCSLVSNVLISGAVVTSEGKQTLSITSDLGTEFQGDKFDKSEEELGPNECNKYIKLSLKSLTSHFSLFKL